MATAVATERRFDFGRVFAETFDVAGKNFLSFAILAAIAALPTTVFSWLVTGTNPFRSARFVVPPGGSASAFVGITFLNFFLAFVFSCILKAALVHGTVVTLNGQRASLGNCLKTGLNSFLPVLAIGFLASLGFLFGMLLLIVPGIILMLGWVVAVPVRVVEHKPIFETFGRSWELTRGHRWALLGIYIVFIMGAAIFAGLSFPLAGLSMGPNGLGGASVIYIVVSAITRILESMFGATLVGVIYYELRSVKEGIGPEALASVFD